MNSPYNSTTLPNGLRVLSYYDPNCPITNINVLVRAGYRFEKPDELGYAHLLEHMLLKGTSRFPAPDLLAAQVTDIGGYQNANTNAERVNYYIIAAREYTEQMVSLLHDMFFDSLIDADVLEREKKVVLEEYEKIRSNNDRFARIEGMKEFFKGHPLGVSLLDADKSTSSATISGLRSYMKQWYASERSALIIGGGIPHEQALALATQHFGNWDRANSPALESVQFTPHNKSHIHIQRDIPSTDIDLLYHAPDASDIRAEAALSMLSTFLSYGQSSFLVRELRHKRSLIYGLQTAQHSARDTGSFSFHTSTASSVSEVVGLARNFIEHATKYFKPEDLERVRRQKLGAFARNLAEMSERTDFMISSFVASDRLYLPDEWIAALNAVTYDDIANVTKLYLRRDNSMLGTMGRIDPGDL